MEIAIKRLAKRDFNRARQFAVVGMHLNWYTRNRLELFLYSHYFWSLEIDRATRAYGAYQGDKLVGVLLADMVKEQPILPSWQRRIFIKLSQWVIKHFYGSMTSQYEGANAEMLATYQQQHHCDGELNFFAVDPTIIGQGLGTRLLNQLAKDMAGQNIYLYTDSGSTYQFYLHRGFSIVGQRELKLEKQGKLIPLTCYLMAKAL
ncbi:GNAT family N-acetyltransferase [Lactiplantibacillus mudanjiangensis]|uniref:N-acetyltransferase domain-containing protein n=1 Tax=Lactiplantibacillus mudanjiangensis TaxID=1296538 RepID=A0A660E383_9LACO|nr:GNAT family N-acetyltransferase [Lactiplantibacillus mudanjiangensis]VDG25471.1 hypothetical protein [Lactobacillus farciminis KCTC 3681 = DSM 20184] [Lactiplantibacillus mudanjiangensis]VDG28565.1 hypothetical protein [Lactobacillus farciminis KCTC 3681 = DSM 20184] [Lactiplantibacillus mudanjiangensis]